MVSLCVPSIYSFVGSCIRNFCSCRHPKQSCKTMQVKQPSPFMYHDYYRIFKFQINVTSYCMVVCQWRLIISKHVNLTPDSFFCWWKVDRKMVVSFQCDLKIIIDRKKMVVSFGSAN